MPAGVAVGAVTKSMADAFPPMNQSILALTNLRWILFEPASGGPKHEVASWTHDEIQGLDVDKGTIDELDDHDDGPKAAAISLILRMADEATKLKLAQKASFPEVQWDS